MKYELVKRKVADLKPDPNQPRKSFDQEAINNLAQTYQSQGIINPIEIDAENVIITGEMRWRAAKVAKIEDVDCKLLTEISDIERFERQTIENLHHNTFTSIERENAIKKLWESGKYKSKEELANILGLEIRYTNTILRAYDTRKELNLDEKASNAISTTTLETIGRLKDKKDQEKIVKKIIKQEIKSEDLGKVVKTIKELEMKAPELKKEFLKPETKITEESIKEIREVAEFPEIEQRENIIKQLKQTKQASKKIIERKKKIADNKIETPIIIEDLDEKFLKIWREIAQNISIKIRKGFLKPYNEKTKQEAYKIVKGIVNFLISEFSEEVKVIGEN